MFDRVYGQSRDEVEVMADLAADVLPEGRGGRLKSHKKSHTRGANRGGSGLLTRSENPHGHCDQQPSFTATAASHPGGREFESP